MADTTATYVRIREGRMMVYQAEEMLAEKDAEIERLRDENVNLRKFITKHTCSLVCWDMMTDEEQSNALKAFLSEDPTATFERGKS